MIFLHPSTHGARTANVYNLLRELRRRLSRFALPALAALQPFVVATPFYAVASTIAFRGNTASDFVDRLAKKVKSPNRTNFCLYIRPRRRVILGHFDDRRRIVA